MRARQGIQWLAILLSLVAPLRAANAPDEPPQHVFDSMREAFRPDKAAGVNVRYLFDLTGPQGGKWWIEVKNNHCRFGRGPIDHPDVTFIASDKDWVAIANGRLSGTWAFLTGRLRIHGSQTLARKLGEMFP